MPAVAKRARARGAGDDELTAANGSLRHELLELTQATTTTADEASGKSAIESGPLVLDNATAPEMLALGVSRFKLTLLVWWEVAVAVVLAVASTVAE